MQIKGLMKAIRNDNIKDNRNGSFSIDPIQYQSLSITGKVIGDEIVTRNFSITGKLECSKLQCNSLEIVGNLRADMVISNELSATLASNNQIGFLKSKKINIKRNVSEKSKQFIDNLISRLNFVSINVANYLPDDKKTNVIIKEISGDSVSIENCTVDTVHCRCLNAVNCCIGVLYYKEEYCVSEDSCISEIIKSN